MEMMWDPELHAANVGHVQQTPTTTKREESNFIGLETDRTARKPSDYAVV